MGRSDLSVYRLSGSKVTEDPSKTPEYREQVAEGLHFGKTAEAKRPYLSKDDLEACKDVVSRKAAAFWVEGTPQTPPSGEFRTIASLLELRSLVNLTR